tara:strand:- start:256 stop:585 length:330 start_codon:yes stop_codon:yes gene_type:complete
MKYNIYIYNIKMPSDNPKIQKAFKDGVITKGQYDKLSDGLLLGIIKKKSGGAKSTTKGEDRKTARKAYEPKEEKPKSKKEGTKEVRHKTGKAKGKPGRPKGGSMVKVEK